MNSKKMALVRLNGTVKALKRLEAQARKTSNMLAHIKADYRMPGL